jgi:predicted phosphohydrolase
MTIQYASDLHLEFRENKQFILRNPLKPVGDVLVLAGDIVPFCLMEDHNDFFDYISDNFEATYWVPGNHEFYHYDLSKKCGTLNEAIRANVWLVNNVAIERPHVRFLFSTLWTKIGMQNRWPIQRGMADFHAITFEGFSFTTFNYNDEHRKCLDFLETALAKKAEKTIVVSHHVPTFMNYPEKYKGDVLNEAFAVELFDLIEQSGSDYWIYGHHHQRVPSFKIGNTSMLNNQLGYVKYNENTGFDGGLVI